MLDPRVSTALCVALLGLGFGCASPTSAPNQLVGLNTALPRSLLSAQFPPSYRETAGWQTAAIAYRTLDQPDNALFCFQQAEETFPSERPDFDPSLEQSRREWSGHPVNTYLARAELHIDQEEFDLAKHYIDKSETCLEHPFDLIYYSEVKGKYLFEQGQYQEAIELLESKNSLFCRLLHAAARFELKDESAKLDLHYLAREVRSFGPNAPLGWSKRLPSRASESFLEFGRMERAKFQ